MCAKRVGTSRISREACGVLRPTLPDFKRKVPSTSQYSSVDPASVEPTIRGRYLRSAPSMDSQVSSVSRTWASASMVSTIDPRFRN